MRRSKKGTYIAEAAVVLPMIILVVITVVLIIMFFYTQVKERCEMHINLRSTAGALIEKTIYIDAGKWDGYVEVEKTPLGGKVKGEKTLNMNNRGILTMKESKEITGYSYATDGVKYVRYCSLVKEKVSNDEE